jgi:REP element-mobilizing transposase RayT
MEVFAYVIMPSHLHMVVRNVNGNLNHIIRDFKSFTAKQILKMIEFENGESRKKWLLQLFSYYAKFHKQNKNYLFWQKTNYPIELDYNEIFDQKVGYIHNNPVEAGYVTDPEYWYYSSANPNSPLLVQEA